MDITSTEMEDIAKEPCLKTDCAELKMSFSKNDEVFKFTFFSSHDFLREDTIRNDIKSVLVMVHGNNRNARDYFKWAVEAIDLLDKTDEVLIIAPYFRTADNIFGNNELLHWSSSGWKRGYKSKNDENTYFGSFEVIDSLISHLIFKSNLSSLKNFVMAGHSSGDQFWNLYAAASPEPFKHATLNFNFIVANSQYFFYPGPERINNSTNEFVIPTSCEGYMDWPFGKNNPTAYMSENDTLEIIDRYLNNKITYLLGTEDTNTTGTVNTDDCLAILLGKNQFERGKNILKYVKEFFEGKHNHSEIIVAGIGQNAQDIFTSQTGIEILNDILN